MHCFSMAFDVFTLTLMSPHLGLTQSAFGAPGRWLHWARLRKATSRLLHLRGTWVQYMWHKPASRAAATAGWWRQQWKWLQC